MKLAILGATGSVGRTLVMQALDADHEVTALVRERPEPGEIDDRVALVVGDVTSADSVNHVGEKLTPCSRLAGLANAPTRQRANARV
jgi:putative NADH-flavin reductase